MPFFWTFSNTADTLDCLHWQYFHLGKLEASPKTFLKKKKNYAYASKKINLF
jgi:hypothetical protein